MSLGVNNNHIVNNFDSPTNQKYKDNDALKKRAREMQEQFDSEINSASCTADESDSSSKRQRLESPERVIIKDEIEIVEHSFVSCSPDVYTKDKTLLRRQNSVSSTSGQSAVSVSKYATNKSKNKSVLTLNNKRSPRRKMPKPSDTSLTNKIPVVLDTSINHNNEESEDYLECGQRVTTNLNFDGSGSELAVAAKSPNGNCILSENELFKSEDHIENSQHPLQSSKGKEIDTDNNENNSSEKLEIIEIASLADPQPSLSKKTEVTSDSSSSSDGEDAVEEYSRKNKITKYCDISPTWRVPPQHWIETRVTHAPTESQKMKFREMGVEMKTGAFNATEDDIIKRNFEFFCKTYDTEMDPELFFNRKETYQGSHFMSQSCFTFSAMNRKQRMGFLRYLGKDLPDRYLYSIYGRFQTLFEPVSCKGRYTKEEDRQLVNLIQNTRTPDKFVMAAEQLGRGRQSVTKRYYLLCNGMKERENTPWSKQKIDEFLGLLLERCRVDDVLNLRGCRIPMVVWQDVGRQMGMPATKLRDFWLVRLASQLFATSDVTLSEIRIKLIKMFRKARVKSLRDIRWTEVAKYFNGLTSLFLWHKFNKLLHHKLPPDCSKENFEECIEYLYKVVVPRLKASKFDSLLRRCSYTKEEGIKFMN